MNMLQRHFSTNPMDDTTDFTGYHDILQRCRTLSEVKNQVVHKLFDQCDSMDELMIIWQAEDQESMISWWSSQAAAASEISVFIYSLFRDILDTCGVAGPDTPEEDIATLVELGKCPPLPGIFHASFLVLDNLMGKLRYIPDDCEFWAAEDDWGGSSGEKVTATHAGYQYHCYVLPGYCG